MSVSVLDPIEALFETVFDPFSPDEAIDYLRANAPGISSFEELEHRLTHDENFLLHSSNELIATPNFNAMCMILDSYRFCVTEKGHIGLVKDEVEEGDEIAIIMEAPTLFALRKASVASAYTLESDAYIRGLMDGGAMKAESCKPDKIILV